MTTAMTDKTAGSRLGPYEIVEPLGSGGMGEVYRARDTRLHRDVALKILAGVDQEDSLRHRRFLQEARAASALNHPNILSVYDVGNDSGAHFIVSELVEGESLRSLIQKGAIPLRKFLDIAIQVASGLTAAHEAGIVHRDLKPENIMVGRDNRVKVLDFGLAKVLMPATGTPDEQTRSHLLTMPGAILGTVAYMSPEQARGGEVDFRSDQFSFGLVLYEMATGQKAFEKNTPVQTLSAIITEDPPSINTVNRKFPAPLRWMIERCLAKDPRDRYGATIDLEHELRDFREHLSETSYSGESSPAGVLARKGRSYLLLGAAIAAAGLLGFLGAAWVAMQRGVAAPSYRFTPLAVNPEAENFAVWSPDGKSVAYTVEIGGVQQLFVRSLASPSAEQITRANQDVLSPFWSADGARIFYTSRDEHRKYSVWAIGIAGGSPELVMQDAAGGAMTHDGKTMVVFRFDEKEESLGLWTSSPPGSKPKKYTNESFRDARFEAMGAAFSHDDSQLLVQTKSGKSGLKCWLIPFPTGEPRSIDFLEGLDLYGASWLPDNRRVLISTGMGEERNHLWVADLRTKSLTPLTSGVMQEWAPDVSPNGKRIVFSSAVQEYDLIEVPLDGSPTRSLTSTPVNEKAPAWSRQGNQFAFVSNITGTDVIWVKSPSEGWQRPLVTEKDFPDQQTVSFSRPFFSPDGQRIAYHRNTKRGLADIWISSVSGGSPVRLYADDRAAQFTPSWSPDGNWIAYLAGEGGAIKLVKTRIGSADAPVMLKQGVSYLQPQWSPDGQWLTCLMPDGLYLISADGKTSRLVSKAQWLTGGWSLDGKLLYSIRQSENRRLLVMATNPDTGEEKLISDAGVSPILSTDAVFAGFSLAPDGRSFATSELKSASDLWILEDFNPNPPSLFSFLKSGVSYGKEKIAH